MAAVAYKKICLVVGGYAIAIAYRKDVECARYKFTGRNFYAKTPGRTIEVYRMRICLSEHFTYGKLFRFVLPSVVMMIFTSVYGVVDGLFVSNFVGKTSFAAVNLIMPFPMGLGAVGLCSERVAARLSPRRWEKGIARGRINIFPCSYMQARQSASFFPSRG